MTPTITQLLAQDRIWVDKEGRIWRLEEMTPRHRRNLLRWLEGRAFALSWAWFSIFDSAPDDVFWQAERELEGGPKAWLEDRPLVIRLRWLDRPLLERILHTVRNMIQ